jgi:hypothetical protein
MADLLRGTAAFTPFAKALQVRLIGYVAELLLYVILCNIVKDW